MRASACVLGTQTRDHADGLGRRGGALVPSGLVGMPRVAPGHRAVPPSEAGRACRRPVTAPAGPRGAVHGAGASQMMTSSVDQSPSGTLQTMPRATSQKPCPWVEPGPPAGCPCDLWGLNIHALLVCVCTGTPACTPGWCFWGARKPLRCPAMCLLGPTGGLPLLLREIRPWRDLPTHGGCGAQALTPWRGGCLHSRTRARHDGGREAALGEQSPVGCTRRATASSGLR